MCSFVRLFAQFDGWLATYTNEMRVYGVNAPETTKSFHIISIHSRCKWKLGYANKSGDIRKLAKERARIEK